MVPVIVMLVVVAVLVSWAGFLYKQSVGRPLWMAFSATAAAVLFSVTGLAGYMLRRHDRFVAHTSWAGHVIWTQVGMGVLAGVAAVYFWRRVRAAGWQV